MSASCRASCRASKSRIAGFHDGALKVRVASPPVDGAANTELVNVLAKRFNVSKSAVEILAGLTSKTKQIKIGGLKSADFARIVKA